FDTLSNIQNRSSKGFNAKNQTHQGSMTGMPYSRTRGLALAGTFAALISVAAQVSIPLPFTPVPITLQVFVVYLVIMILGPYYGSLALLIYLLLGAIGVPVYANVSSGLPVLLGP